MNVSFITHPDFLLLSAKIRCCHLRNNTLSMWYEVFLILLILTVWVVWVGLFIYGILRITWCVCVFCVCYLAATLRRTIDEPSVSTSLPLVLRQVDDGSIHPVPILFGMVLVGFSVGLPRLCFGMLHFGGKLILQNQSCKKLYTTEKKNI